MPAAISAELPHDFTVALIGAGAQGVDLASLAIRAGFRTVVEDVFPSKLRNLTERLRQEFDGDTMHRHLVFATSVEEAVRQADFALDSVPDELESKLEIFSLLDRMAPPRTILCSPMADTSISDLQACTYRADRCIAVQKASGESWKDSQQVTLVRGAATSDQAASIAEAVWRRMGKQVVMELETVATLS